MYASSSKRRRTSMSSSASKDDETGSVDLEYQPADSTKRKRAPPNKLQDPIEQCQQLYDIIRGHKKEDGSLLCEPFIRVPKRRQEPAYYEVVSNPMDMIRIQQKIKMDEYEDLEQMSTDVDLMLTNAKAFYKKSTQEHKDASDLWDLFIESKCRLFDRDSPTEEGKGKIILKMGKLARRAAAAEARKPTVTDIDGGETSESSTTTDKDRHEDSLDKGDVFNQLEELFSSVMTAKDTDDRPLHTVFQLIPSRKKYPSYYEIIENPIDLKMIAMKVQAGDYNSLTEMEKDLMLMCRNACTFNEPGSKIYKDAKSLKKLVAAKKYELESGRHNVSTPGKTSERIRNRRLRSGISHSAIAAALQYEDDDEEEEKEDMGQEEEIDSDESMDDEERVEDEEDDDEEEEEEDETFKGDSEDPMWVLFESINNYITPGGKQISDPFKRLPSRRYYADYYKEIKNPISLAMIKARIQRKEYVNLTQVQADMNVMFENAKAYNMPESTIYKSAAKLQKVLHAKVAELIEPDDEESSNDDLSLGINKRATPLPGIALEDDDYVLDSSAVGDDGTPNTSASSNKTPTSGKRGIVKTKGVVGVSPAATSYASRTSPHKEDKSFKNLGAKDQFKRRLQALYDAVAEYTEPGGRVPIDMFMEKPSKKLYPDYYRVILEPIDMMTIKANIDCEKYNNCDELMNDFKLMFNNCRQYNEEGSSIYEDANKLEKILNEKLRHLGPDPCKPKIKRKKNPLMLLKQKNLLDTVRDHKDKNGRQLSIIFQKLPSKAEYPEYYEIIKNPIDLDRICTKQRTSSYETLDQLSSDLMLMFDNACKFNEPDSQIYKDALILQRLVLQTKLSLSSEDDGIPDVAGAVKEILISIFTSVYNHQDEEGRCYSDTLSELPEHDEVDGQKVRAVSLDLLKSRLDRGYYKRLDSFQRDMFLCFERARKLSRTDSQVFEDSVELQSFFIKTRDDICKNGEVLKSPALSYSQCDLEGSVEAMKLEKKIQEPPQEDDLSSVEVKKEDVESAAPSSSQSESYNEQTYCIGDFVYVTPSGATSLDGAAGVAASKTAGVTPNIANIQKLWTATDGTKWFEGIWFFRPDQTYHIPTRKFLQKEVFRSEVRSTAMLSEIVGKCWVMTVKGKEYFNYAPEGYSEDDVYVCEYRYSSRGRCFTKLKAWAFGSERVKLVARDKPLEPIRVASVFRERVEKHKEELQLMEDDLEKAAAEDYPNIELPAVAGKEGMQYYEQFNLSCGPIRRGDFVYVRVENAKKLVARVDSMWADANGTTFFHGPWFTSLSEISPNTVIPGRVFYKQEIFQSSIEDTNPLLSICGKCSVLDIQDYMKWRPTEVLESDVFLCESLYDEARRQIKKFDGLKQYEHQSCDVHKDEIYCFRKPIVLVKVDLDGTVVPEMPKLKVATKFDPGSPMGGFKMDIDSMTEDSMDGSPPSLGSLSETTAGLTSVASVPSGPATPTPTSVKKPTKTPGKKLVTGYILYSSEVRRSVAERNPNSGFGEISRMVGQDWKKLSRADKQKYEDRAAKLNQEKETAFAAGIDPATIGPGSQKYKENAAKAENDLAAATLAMKKDPDWIFECCWGDCDWQFEDALDLIEHSVQEPNGHVPAFFKNQATEGDFQCHWRSCARVKKGVNPFPSLSRLLKHVREIHILKGNGRIIHSDMRSKKVVVSRNPSIMKVIASAPKPAPPPPVPVTSVAAPAVHAPPSLPASSPPLSAAVTSQLAPPPQHQPTQIIVRAAQPAEPLFVAVPPRPQKLLHSEAYIRYIESLHSQRKHMTDWEKSLKADKETVKPAEADKVPGNWLANGPGAHGSVHDALWALRNFMLKDALNLHKSLNR